MARTITRSYEALHVDFDTQKHEKMLKTFDLFLTGSTGWTEYFLSLMGGLDDSHLSNLKPQNYRLVEEEKEPNGKKEKNVSFRQLPRQVVLFSFWFSLESKDKAPHEFALSKDKVWPNYLNYLKELHLESPKDTWLETIQHAVMATDEDSVWVDRRAAFRKLNKELKIPKEYLKQFFGKNFLLGKVEDVDSDITNFTRSFLSNAWGDENAKSDYGQENIFIASCRKLLGKYVNEANGWQEALRNDIVSRMEGLKKKGRHNRLIKFANGEKTPSTLADVKTWILEAEEKLNDRKNFPLGEWTANLQKYVEKYATISYINTKGTRRLEEFGEMFNLSLQRIRSWKSNFYNQLGRREQLAQMPDLPKNPVYQELKAWILDYLSSNESLEPFPRLHRGQLNGFNAISDQWQKNPVSRWEQVVKEEQENCDNSRERFGNVNLFLHLAKKCAVYPNLKWGEILDTYQKWHENKYKLMTLKSPFLRHISEKYPEYPNFGNSRPKFKLENLKNKDDKIILQLSLWDGSDFTPVDLEIASNRLLNEILVRNEKLTEAPRNHSLFRTNGEEISPTGEVKSLKLMPSREPWRNRPNMYRCYFKVGVEFPEGKAPNVKSYLLESPAGARILGLDLGTREAGAYSVLEKVEPQKSSKSFLVHNNQTYVKRNDIWFRVVQTGFLQDMQKIAPHHQEEFGKEKIDRLDDKAWNFKLNQKEHELWNKWKSLGIVNRDIPCSLHALNRQLACGLKRYTNYLISKVRKETGAKTKENLQPHIVKALKPNLIVEAFNQLKGRKEDGHLRIGAGGLTLHRIETFAILKKVCQNYLSWVEDKEIAAIDEQIQTKINNLRTERIRVTVHELLTVAKSYDCKVIFAEDLTIERNRSSSKQMNRTNAVWCPKGVIKELKMQVRMYGIAVWSVNTFKLSHSDFSTGVEGPRIEKIKLSYLRNKKEHYYKRLNSLFRSFKMENQSSTTPLYLNGWRKLFDKWNLGELSFVNLLEFAKKNPDLEVHVPMRGGSLFHTEANGYLNADINAAHNSALVGVQHLLSEKPKVKKPEKIAS